MMLSEQPAKTLTERRADRQAFDAVVQFRSGSRRAEVKVRDVSALGARIAGVFLVREGDEFFLKLPMIESIAVRVVWVEGFEFGCEFARPLSDAVLTAIVNAQS